MRIASPILALLGGLFSGAIGAKWISDARQYADQLELASELGIDTGSMVTAAYLLLVAFAASLIGGFYALKGKGKVAAGILLTAGIAPVLFEGKALLPTFLVLIAGLLALRIKPAPIA